MSLENFVLWVAVVSTMVFVVAVIIAAAGPIESVFVQMSGWVCGISATLAILAGALWYFFPEWLR